MKLLTLDEILSMLTEAGFKKTQVFWQNFNFIGMLCIKEAEGKFSTDLSKIAPNEFFQIHKSIPKEILSILSKIIFDKDIKTKIFMIFLSISLNFIFKHS